MENLLNDKGIEKMITFVLVQVIEYLDLGMMIYYVEKPKETTIKRTKYHDCHKIS